MKGFCVTFFFFILLFTFEEEEKTWHSLLKIATLIIVGPQIEKVHTSFTFSLQVAMSVCPLLEARVPCHLCFKQAQPKMFHSPKVEDRVENQFFTS